MVLLTLISIGYFKSISKNDFFKVMDLPDFELINQNNEPISQNDLADKVVIVEFFFANCPSICPVMNRNLKSLFDEFQHPDLAIISITIDPKRDTPEQLKNYSDRLNINSPNWHFLSADRAYIEELSKKFNIYIGKDTSTAEFLEHSGKVALVNKKGEIVSRYRENGMPMLYYSAVNYLDAEGKQENLSGTFHPEVDWLKEDVWKLLND